MKLIALVTIVVAVKAGSATSVAPGEEFNAPTEEVDGLVSRGFAKLPDADAEKAAKAAEKAAKAEKQAAEKAAAEQAEAERLAAEQAEADRLAELAEAERLAAEQAKG